MAKRPEITEQTKAELRQAFWLLYTSKPLDRITVGEVCARAGYNRSTFYLHFHDLDEVLQSIEDALLAGMVECVERCMESLRKDSSKLGCLAACKDVLVYYERNKAHITVLLSSQGDPSFVFKLKDSLKPLWKAYLVSPHGARSSAEIDLLLEYTLGGTMSMISSWLLAPHGVSAWELAHLIYDFSIKDFRARSKA